MRILFTIGDAYLPQRSGGAQSSTWQLVEELRAQGHAVAVMCRLSGGGWTEMSSRIKRRIGRTRFSRDALPGHTVFRAWDPTDTTEVVLKFRPDVAVVQNGSTIPIARSLEAHGVPVVVYFRNVEFEELEGSPADLKRALFVANSQFTAKRHEEAFGITCTVIPPLVNADLYRTKSSRANVTFINPYPVKGLDIALAVAERCPDIPFTFVESWGINTELRTLLDQRLARLPNVTLQPRTSDMKTVYGKTRILLAPSLWEEAWGRVATEAHYSGIPVIGSQRGGLPEAIGPGGLILDIDAPVSDWAAAVRRLWEDPDEYARLSASALEFSQRPEIQAGYQVNQLLKVLHEARSGARR
ncbi:glycosyltransferase family 4 protein [Falsirhodobacter sp. 1013]|uniref:glycosyltransferase family 4 protein n=1 Tax=Falsirhodobacter sp. 1013 TaxID=3417566 RepID=UPI003EBAE269